ncbi:MAG TPA: folylpolyglutamate synthase/dihydrofolate synthase family protein [Chloroflexota bacterium]|nr:folylpolyglutamate synthase/dihydrofolate synthase family protein [Chloroflexota bacterium]
MTTLQQSFDYLESLYHRPILPPEQVGLRRIEYLLGRLGNPESSFRAIHVTGTCGKGSTTTMIGCILRASGYRTGVFRSPHLESYLERLEIDGEMVGESEWCALFDEVKPLAEAMESGQAPGYEAGGRPSLFEFVWAMAALFFARQSIDVGAIEVGVGGRLSPTNVLHPEVAVLTNVSLDHTKLLGATEREIGREKAHIIKSGSQATTAARHPEVLEEIRRRCQSVEAPLWVVGDEVTVDIRRGSFDGEVIDVRTPVGEYRELAVPLLGRHQAINAATAVSAIDQFTGSGGRVSRGAVSEGLASARLPGRFEIVSTDPLIILDCARNSASARVLRETIDQLLPDRTVVMLGGVLADKDAAAVAHNLGPRLRAAVVTQPPWAERTGDPERLAGPLREHVDAVEVQQDPDAALSLALSRLTEDDVLLVTGSLYLVAAIRKRLLKPEREASLAARVPAAMTGSPPGLPGLTADRPQV